MTTIELIRAEIDRRIKEYDAIIESQPDSDRAERDAWKWAECKSLLSFLDTLEEEPEEESDLQDAEVIFSGYALHTDVTKWADGYKLKIRIYDDN